MEKRKIAIACQGDGIHGAYTCGVLTQILQAAIDDEKGQLLTGAKRRFEISGLSGTSAGALNAFNWDGLFSQNPPVREFLANVEDTDLIPDDIWVIRINPQKRDDEPEELGDIEDRRNELAGNLSLNQERLFIAKVNEWLKKYPKDFGAKKKPIGIYMITMSEEWSDKLRPASKFNRDPAFVKELRDDGEKRGAEFLKRWYTESDHRLRNLQWPNEILEE